MTTLVHLPITPDLVQKEPPWELPEVFQEDGHMRLAFDQLTDETVIWLLRPPHVPGTYNVRVAWHPSVVSRGSVVWACGLFLALTPAMTERVKNLPNVREVRSMDPEQSIARVVVKESQALKHLQLVLRRRASHSKDTMPCDAVVSAVTLERMP